MHSKTMQSSIILILLLLAACRVDNPTGGLTLNEISDESEELAKKTLRDSSKTLKLAKELYENKAVTRKEELQEAIKAVESSRKLDGFKGSEKEFLAAVKKHVEETKKLSKLTKEIVTELEGEVTRAEKKKEKCLVGDANQDNKLNHKDLEIYVKYWLEPESKKLPKKLCCVDINKDDKVDEKDKELFFHSYYVKQEGLGTC